MLDRKSILLIAVCSVLTCALTAQDAHASVHLTLGKQTSSKLQTSSQTKEETIPVKLEDRSDKDVEPETYSIDRYGWQAPPADADREVAVNETVSHQVFLDALLVPTNPDPHGLLKPPQGVDY